MYVSHIAILSLIVAFCFGLVESKHLGADTHVSAADAAKECESRFYAWLGSIALNAFDGTTNAKSIARAEDILPSVCGKAWNETNREAYRHYLGYVDRYYKTGDKSREPSTQEDDQNDQWANVFAAVLTLRRQPANSAEIYGVAGRVVQEMVLGGGKPYFTYFLLAQKLGALEPDPKARRALYDASLCALVLGWLNREPLATLTLRRILPEHMRNSKDYLLLHALNRLLNKGSEEQYVFNPQRLGDGHHTSSIDSALQLDFLRKTGAIHRRGVRCIELNFTRRATVCLIPLAAGSPSPAP